MSDVTEEQVTKPKKVMSEDQLAKLAVARSKALQVRRQQHAEKLKQRAREQRPGSRTLPRGCRRQRYPPGAEQWQRDAE